MSSETTGAEESEIVRERDEGVRPTELSPRSSDELSGESGRLDGFF